MSVSNPSAATASQPKSSDLDIEQLVGLLGSLMPLLLQFQSQTQQQSYQPGTVVVPNPALDRQAAENLIGDMVAESLRTLSAYLESNAGLHAGLEGCVPNVTQAAHRPDPRVSLLRAPRLANLSPFCGLHPAVRCLRDEGTRRPCRAADVGSSTIGVRN